MILYSPANSIREAEEVIKAGADGIYIGGVTTIYSNYPNNSNDWTIGENKLSVREFKELVEFCHRNKVLVQYNVYTDCLSDSVSTEHNLADYFTDYVKFGLDAGVDSILLDDISAIMRVNKIDPNIDIHASFLFDIVNTEQLKFFKSLNVKTVELSPQLAIKEIYELSENSPLSLGLISHLNCAAYEGSCYIDHFIENDHKMIPIGLPCKSNYRITIDDDKTVEGSFIDMTLSCSVCNMPALINSNINYIKIPGRHIDFSLILNWTMVYREAINLLKSGYVSTGQELRDNIIKKYPNWSLWCRLNRKKGCLYDDENSVSKFCMSRVI